MPCYRFGPFELDPEARVLRRECEPVALPGKTLDTLVVLVENRGRLVDKEELLSRVWADSVVEEANLTRAIFTVRKILGDSPKNHHYIATVAGRGYQFVAPVTEPITTVQAPSPTPEEALSSWHRNRIFGFSLAGVITVSLAVALAFWIVRRSGEMRVQTPEVQRFTSYPGVETMPAFSPDGKQIAYVRAEHDVSFVHSWRREGGQANVYTKLVGAATELRLTNHPGADYYPAWSPDGQYIAFYRDEPGASGFYIVSALGGQERRITNKETETLGIAWLPDGRHLVASHFSEESYPSSLVEISLDTGEERPVTSPPARDLGDNWPAISPDGKMLAFVRLKSDRAVDICFAPLTGVPAPRCRPLQVHWPQGLAWTASGDGIIVSGIHNGPFQLWPYRMKSGDLQALTSGEENAVLPTSARQGNHLAYVLYARNVNLWELDVSSFPSVDPANARPIASSTRMQVDPAISPDGHKVAYLSDRSGTQEIWVTDTDTQTSTQLTHFGGPPTGSPSWSPDGLKIAFDSEQGAETNIFVMSADGGVPRRVTGGAAENCVPSWSHDGKFIYFASDRGGEFQVWKVSAATGETRSHPATQVTHGGGFRAFESKDGQYLYYAKGRGKQGLWRQHLSDGKEEPVLDSLQGWCLWALGPEAIYFLELPGSVHPEVHLKALEIPEDRIRDLGKLRHPVVNGTTAIAVSPDGRRLTYTQIDSLESDIMLMSKVR